MMQGRRCGRERDRPQALVVDDDRRLRRVLAWEMEREFRVFEANGYDQALEVLASHSEVVAVVTDYHMGGGPSGVELLEWCQQRVPSAVRFLISGEARNPIFDEVVAQGLAHAFVPKPWRRGQLCAAVKRALDEEQQRAFRSHPPRSEGSHPDGAASVG